MLKLITKISCIITFFLLVLLFLQNNFIAVAQDATPTPVSDSQETKDLKKRIDELQSKIGDLQKQEKTLSSQIAVMDSQIDLTQVRIDSTKQQILELTANIDTANKKIDNLQKSLNDLMQVLVKRIIATYEVGSAPSFQVLLSSTNVTNLFTRLNYLKIAQAHDKQLIYSTQQAKMDYANQKDIFEDRKKQVENLKKQLEDYNAQLDSQKTEKQRLLNETQGSEANFQSLLAQAKAQLAGFQRFVASQGGASILSNQTVCDDWGCYYNQRDSQWGNNSLNNTQYTIASDGCLVTSMAMIYTHFGHKSVTPITINSNPSNFASYYPAYLNKTIVADGTTTTRIASEIDAELSSGRPVVVGVGGGPDHFVVLIGGSGGNYLMNDPFVPNGHRINFSDHYSLNSISEIDKISGF